ncbi:MAG: FAD-binding oxidoreductase [Bernardetiaceae bacterium]
MNKQPSLRPRVKDAIADLQRQISGRVVTPTDPHYNAARAEFNPAYEDFPLLVVFCEAYADVRLSLAFAQTHGLWTVARSGRHSLAGYSVSSGMVLDVSQLNDVSVDVSKKQAKIGAGATFEKIYRILNDYQLHLPGGGCGTVGVAGFMQGGGYSMTSRAYGISSDSVLEFTMMLADGRIVVANRTQNQDLFWAVRGGTGNNFGVLLDVTYQLYDLYEVWGFSLTWDFEEDVAEAAEALLILQSQYMGKAYPKLGHQTSMYVDDAGRHTLIMMGVYDGTEAEGKALIAPLLQLPSTTIYQSLYAPYLQVDQEVFQTVPNVPLGVKALSQSGYIARMLTRQDWVSILSFFKTAPNNYAMIDLEAYGGKINEIPVTDSAFIHRQVYMDFFCDVFWEDETDRAANQAWLQDLQAFMRPYFNGHSYQNYPNRLQTDYRWAYWGPYFNTLLAIKRKYDPENFFYFQQSIKPYAPEDVNVYPDKPLLFDGGQILYEEY